MNRDTKSSRNPVGRPPKPMPPPIPDTPENVAKAILFSPPKRDEEWEYLSNQDEAHSVDPEPRQPN